MDNYIRICDIIENANYLFHKPHVQKVSMVHTYKFRSFLDTTFNHNLNDTQDTRPPKNTQLPPFASSADNATLRAQFRELRQVGYGVGSQPTKRVGILRDPWKLIESWYRNVWHFCTGVGFFFGMFRVGSMLKLPGLYISCFFSGRKTEKQSRGIPEKNHQIQSTKNRWKSIGIRTILGKATGLLDSNQLTNNQTVEKAGKHRNIPTIFVRQLDCWVPWVFPGIDGNFHAPHRLFPGRRRFGHVFLVGPEGLWDERGRSTHAATWPVVLGKNFEVGWVGQCEDRLC